MFKMLNFLRISAIIQRHMISMFRDPARILDAFYWPLIDLTLFGLMANWAQESMVHTFNFQLTLLTCITAQYLVYRSSLEISKSLLIEIWDNHLVNLFASPISLCELMVSFISISVVNALITFAYSITIILLVYKQNIFVLLLPLLPFIALLLVSGWIIGLLIAVFLLYSGRSAEIITWSLPWLFATFTGAFYPIKVLPVYIQKIAYFFPATYLFEGIRELIATNKVPVNNLITALILSIFYLVLVVLLLNRAFKCSKKAGLSRLE